MNRTLLVVGPFISLFFFPWPLTLVLTLGAAWREPLLTIAVGIAADLLYYSTALSLPPLATLGGLGVTGIFFIVQRRLSSGMMS